MKLEFSNIKESYLEIKTFLENASGQKINGLNTRIAEDLGLFGDDNYFLLTEFAEKYDVDFESFEYDKHFESEGELFNSFRVFISILSLPFFLIAKIMKFIFPKINIDLSNLVVSKLKGEFCLRKNIQIEI